MYNLQTIAADAEHRRQEWQRAVTAERLAALARVDHPGGHHSRPHLARLWSLAARLLPLAAPLRPCHAAAHPVEC